MQDNSAEGIFMLHHLLTQELLTDLGEVFY
jgi:hypothetical protein